jgi:hypothetical protein
LNAGHISQTQCRHADAQPRIVAVGPIHQRNAARKARLTRPTNLLQRDLRLGPNSGRGLYALAKRIKS